MYKKRFCWTVNIVMVISCILFTILFVLWPILNYYSLSTKQEEILLGRVDDVVQEYQEKVVHGEINDYTDETEVELYRVDNRLTFKITLKDTSSKSWVEVRYPAIITDEGILIIETKSSDVTVSTQKTLGDLYLGIFCFVLLIPLIIYTCWLLIASCYR